MRIDSLLKLPRRLLMPGPGDEPLGAVSRPEMLYPVAYLMLTQAMTGLLICAGLLGRSVLAADIGIVQAATLATFFAFSGNARNLILTERANVHRGAILAARLALLLPLGSVAVLFCLIVGHVDLALILILIARRSIEWIGELHLSESELLGHRAVARNSVLLQSVLLAVAVAAIGVESEYALWALAAWALLPALPLARFVAAGTTGSFAAMRNAMALLLPHFGSTAASGMSLYAFRALLVLVAGKPVAGDLFAAFAIGSFPGSMFANILGPSVSLHEERVGRSRLPKFLTLATVAYLVGGVALLVLHWAAPASLGAIGRPPLFWAALGWSLVGGATMVVAQRVRLQLFSERDGRTVFGADLLMHVCLIAAVPALYTIGRADGFAYLYLLNALLALLFYLSGVHAEVAPFGDRIMKWMAFGTVFLIFLPMFFYINGDLFNPLEPVVDSGGTLRNLPLPVSLIACNVAVLLYGRFSRAFVGLWVIFGLLFLMLVSTAVAGNDSGVLDRVKILVLLQVILPTFGLVLGAVMDPDGRYRHVLEAAILAVVAIVVPAQLAASWLYGGTPALSHFVFFFGVYQHLQFVPVILVCGYLIAFPALWARWGYSGKLALSVLLALIAVYAVASASALSMFAVVVGITSFGAIRLRRSREAGAALASLLALGCFAGYLLVQGQTHEFHHKFRFLFPAGKEPAEMTATSAGVRSHVFGGWDIVGMPEPAYILRFGPAEYARQAKLVIEGRLDEGEIRFAVEIKPAKKFVFKETVSRRGPFRVEIPVDRDRDESDVLIYQQTVPARGYVRSAQWIFSEPARHKLGSGFPIGTAIAAGDAPRGPSRDAEPMLDTAPNVSQRIADWRLFGRGIFDSPWTLLFGHPQPLAREVRSSAHNFYIDFAYTFGVLALLPVLSLIGFTAILIWRRRGEVLASDSMLALAAVVAFLVLVDSNLKVSLRQPYPGIVIFFLWGLLLARLRAPAVPASGAG